MCCSDFELGKLRCDNRIAAVFSEHGYQVRARLHARAPNAHARKPQVTNPAMDVVAWHVQQSRKRQYKYIPTDAHTRACIAILSVTFVRPIEWSNPQGGGRSAGTRSIRAHIAAASALAPATRFRQQAVIPCVRLCLQRASSTVLSREVVRSADF